MFPDRPARQGLMRKQEGDGEMSQNRGYWQKRDASIHRSLFQLKSTFLVPNVPKLKLISDSLALSTAIVNTKKIKIIIIIHQYSLSTCIEAELTLKSCQHPQFVVCHKQIDVIISFTIIKYPSIFFGQLLKIKINR